MTTDEYLTRQAEIQRQIESVVPVSLRRVCPMSYRQALNAKSVAAAERIVQRHADALSIPVVQSFRSRKRDQMKFLKTSSDYSQDRSDPRTFADRPAVPTGSVESFSPDTVRPRMRIRVQPRARYPKSYIGEWSGRRWTYDADFQPRDHE